jgi:hypothetical protein
LSSKGQDKPLLNQYINVKRERTTNIKLTGLIKSCCTHVLVDQNTGNIKCWYITVVNIFLQILWLNIFRHCHGWITLISLHLFSSIINVLNKHSTTIYIKASMVSLISLPTLKKISTATNDKSHVWWRTRSMKMHYSGAPHIHDFTRYP